MKVRFLLDENLSPFGFGSSDSTETAKTPTSSPRLKVAVLRLNPAIDILRIGESNTPILGTLDPDVLRYLQLSQRLLVTDNRASMPAHLEAHWAEGGNIWGLFWLRPRIPIGQLAQELLLVWETTEAEEWINQLEWIPF